MNTSLYFHIPFCRRRCGYCDFNTFAGLDSLIPEYVNSLCQEVKIVADLAPQKVKVGTIYFGGGTPSLLTLGQISSILETVKAKMTLDEQAEISMEANPGTVSSAYLRELRSLGLTRMSFGMQSSSPEDLRILDREHHYGDIINAVTWSIKAGFQHINLDLIFGIPGQTRDGWRKVLQFAHLSGVDHFSLYSLIIEDGTRLKKWIDRGLLTAPDDELAAAMYADAMRILDSWGMAQYEISNWAMVDAAQCRHNLQYWRYLPYLGFGAGAHGFVGSTRTENISGIQNYIQAIRLGKESHYPCSPAVLIETKLNEWEMIQEHLMVSLRLTQEGIDLDDFQEQHGVRVESLFPRQIGRLQKLGLIEWFDQNRGLRLTQKGRMFGNRVFSEFVANKVPEGYEYLVNQ